MEFLEELVENDIVERSIGLIDQFKMGIKCIIVTDDEPTNS